MCTDKLVCAILVILHLFFLLPDNPSHYRRIVLVYTYLDFVPCDLGHRAVATLVVIHSSARARSTKSQAEREDDARYLTIFEIVSKFGIQSNSDSIRHNLNTVGVPAK